MYTTAIKPSLEFTVAFLLCIIFSPIMLFIAIALWFLNNRQILFIQQRSGRNGGIFYLLKFKTMTDFVDEGGTLLSDELRLTTFGRFLRLTSLDELPQLINILKGDMGLVGPRPLLPEYYSLFNAQHKLRFNVKPGLTGLAQIKGRNLLGWKERLDLDVMYVRHISLLNDVKILLMTVAIVLTGNGVNTSDGSTMPKFTGC
ncbi:MAG: sugar transferase [Bacteroidetes bacterium]|nr:sugar transferase [Bacteroidota bacterium]MDA1121066.1 sugar transferase [Bacteroidota bacterium]